MAIVVFDPDEFRELYPQFADLTDIQLEFYFEQATAIIDNTECSKVPYDPPRNNLRKLILYALVCHLAELALRGGGATGPMTNASEGSVSAGFATYSRQNGWWFNQTQCGATAYQLMLKFMVGGRLYRGCFR